MIRYSQNSPRWERVKLGQSSLTVGGHGCLITCIAMILTKFYPKHKYPKRKQWTPDKLARFLDFTDDDYKYGGGLILWQKNIKKFRQLGLDFVGRYRSFDHEKDIEKINKFSKSEKYAPILEVRTKRGGRHWVTPIGRALTWRGIGWGCLDPWNGSMQWKTVGFGAPYKYEIGWCLFRKVGN